MTSLFAPARATQGTRIDSRHTRRHRSLSRSTSCLLVRQSVRQPAWSLQTATVNVGREKIVWEGPFTSQSCVYNKAYRALFHTHLSGDVFQCPTRCCLQVVASSRRWFVLGLSAVRGLPSWRWQNMGTEEEVVVEDTMEEGEDTMGEGEDTPWAWGTMAAA